MSDIFLLDAGQLSVLRRVETRLYNEMERLSADDRRDLANTLNAIRHSVESLGAIDPEPIDRVRCMCRGCLCGAHWVNRIDVEELKRLNP